MIRCALTTADKATAVQPATPTNTATVTHADSPMAARLTRRAPTPIVMIQRVREMAMTAGFNAVRRLDIDHSINAFYEITR